MSRTDISRLLLTALFATIVSATSAGSLWLNGRDLYSSQGSSHEFKPGDIITVMISEAATAQQAATTNAQDDVAVEVKSDPQIPFFKKVVNQFIGKNEAKNSWKGTGTTTRSGKLDGTVTTTVMEILPNGNLVLEGTRSVRVNRETQLLRVKGVARPQDISPGNEIKSSLLANADIKYDGKGSVGTTQKPGLMTKITQVLF
ncbi:MAG TPA: flagellar basal body L-ring protein FlgH [Candidatus Ozemobacteraceae bacterium]|nr:flagellar basal body L-ring protein FlgH [Candidatus Ozemobacteraceae bacterium]